jgi:hypothetical protein
VTHRRLFHQRLSSAARTPRRALGGFPASWTIRSSLMVGHRCVLQRGGGIRIPPCQHHEERQSPKGAASSVALRSIRSGNPTCCSRPTRRFGSCPPAAPSGFLVTLPEPPVLL